MEDVGREWHSNFARMLDALRIPEGYLEDESVGHVNTDLLPILTREQLGELEATLGERYVGSKGSYGAAVMAGLRVVRSPIKVFVGVDTSLKLRTFPIADVRGVALGQADFGGTMTVHDEGYLGEPAVRHDEVMPSEKEQLQREIYMVFLPDWADAICEFRDLKVSTRMLVLEHFTYRKTERDAFLASLRLAKDEAVRNELKVELLGGIMVNYREKKPAGASGLDSNQLARGWKGDVDARFFTPFGKGAK